MTEHVLQSISDDGIATVTLNRPEAMNALTPAMLDTLAETLEKWAGDSAIRVIVITGSGKAFCAGLDLKAMNDLTPENGQVSDTVDIPGRWLTTAIVNAPQPVIAKINGFCFTGGLEMALACDLLYAADKAKLGDTHAKWGIKPSWGMSQRLPRRVGPLLARELSYTARFVSGEEAANIGLVNATVTTEQLDAHVANICQQILANSPGSIAAYKDLYEQTDGLPLAAGLNYEAETRYPISDTAERLAEFIR